MYLPTMQEVLAGLQRAMDAEVIPFIDDEYALAQATMVRTELASLARLSDMLPGFLALEDGNVVPFAERIRNEVGVPTIAVGNIQGADHVNTILAAGRADLCALARPHLKDPYFTLRAAEELEHWDVHYPDQYLSVKPRPR